MPVAPRVEGGEAPSIFASIERVELLEHLDRLSSHRLLRIRGEEGSGKTTLIADYVARRRLPTLWISLSPADNDAGCFFSHVHAVLRGYLRARCLPPFVSVHAGDIAGFARRFFDALFDRLPVGVMLVLDNCEVIEEVSELPILLREGLDVLPANTRWCLIGQSGANSDIDYLVDTFRGATYDLHAPSDDLIAATRIFSLCEAINPPHSTGKVLYIACAQHLLESLRPSDRRALMTLATLDRFPLSVVNALIPESNLPSVLTNWWRKQILVERRGHLLSFHPIFRQLLMDMQRAQETSVSQKETLASLARACEQVQAVEMVLRIHRQAEDWAALNEVLRRHGQGEIHGGRWTRLRAWIQAAPDEVLEDLPMLRYWLGRAWQPVKPELARLCFRRALAQFEALNESQGRALCLAGLIWTSLDYPSARQDLADLARALDQCLEERVKFDARNLELMTLSALQVASLWSGTAPGGLAQHCNRIHELMSTFELTRDEKLKAASHLLEYYGVSGRVDLGKRLVEQISIECPRVETATIEGSEWTLAVAQHCALTGDEANALNLARVVVDSAQVAGFRALELCARQTRAPLLIAFNRLTEAQYDVEVCAALITPGDHASEARQAILNAMLALALGNDKEAMREADRFGRIATHAVPQYMLLQWGALPVLWHARRMQYDSASALLAQMERRAQHFSHAAWRASVCFLQAYVARQRENGFECRMYLARGLSLLEECADWRHYLRPMVPYVSVLVAFALRNDIRSDVAATLVHNLSLPAPGQCEFDWRWRTRVYTLGEVRIAQSDAVDQASTTMQKRLRELLVALVCARNQGIDEQMVLRSVDLESSHRGRKRRIASTVKALRAHLGDPLALRWDARVLRLDEGYCWVDSWCFSDWALTDPRRALPVYGGPFAPDHDDAMVRSERERLSRQYAQATVAVGQEYESAAQYDAALALYRAALQVDTQCEAFYQGIMRCELELGRPREATRAYDLLIRALATNPVTSPSPLTQRIYASAVEANKNGDRPQS